jgi:lipoprotein NlpI
MISITPHKFEKIVQLNRTQSTNSMEIHILRAGEQVGPYSETQVRQYLGEGVVSSSDLAFHEGMDTWQTLELLLAELPPAPVPDPSPSLSPENPSPESPVIAENIPTPLPEPLSTPPNPMAEVSPSTFTPPPDEAEPSLTDSQKTKRKLSKIVIQPILPLQPTAPPKKKSRTGKTALTLEPLRPTTSLPPITGHTPPVKKRGKTPVKANPIELKQLPAKPAATSPGKPSLPPVTSNEVKKPEAVPSQTTYLRPEIATEKPAPEPWYDQIPRGILYGAAALVLIIVCIVLLWLYFTNSHGQSAANLENAPPVPTQVTPRAPDAAPKTAQDFSDRGFSREAKGHLDAALQDYDQALAIDPKNVEACYRRGLARQAKGDLDGALSDFSQAIALDPKRANAFSSRGFIKQARGDADGALADYTQALRLNPKIPAAYYNEGLIKVQKGDLDDAIAAYNRALELDPRMAVAYYNRGVAKNTEGDLDGAIADYTQALAVNPNIARAYCDRGFARQSKGDTAGALADYAAALALNPHMAPAYYNRGLIKAQKGDLGGAVADNTQAIALDPKDAQAYYNRGMAFLGKGTLDQASSDLNKFCDLSPRDASADTARLYLWLISKQENPKSDADANLSTSLLNDWNSTPEDLTSKIAAFLLGHISESDLIANAASPDPAREPGQYCRVWYFAGMKRLLDGDMPTAISYFQKSMATQQKDFCEYIFANAELQALGQNRETASKS